MRLLFNIIHALLFLSIASFVVFVSLVGDPELKYKHSGFGAVAIPMIIINSILGWLYWKIAGKPDESYSKWLNQGSGKVISIISSIIFAFSILFALYRTL